MKATLWYDSINPRERAAVRLVLEFLGEARVIDVASDHSFRETASESGWPDRHVRSFPCLVLDADDGEVELERAEGDITGKVVTAAMLAAGKHEQKLESALSEARKHDFKTSGGARPIPISELREKPGETSSPGAAPVVKRPKKRKK